MATIRDQIMINVISRLETITVSNGYETDLGNNVTEHRTTDIEDQHMEFIHFTANLSNTLCHVVFSTCMH